MMMQYTPHMTWTALGLVGVNILGGGTTVIIRHIRKVHWATQVWPWIYLSNLKVFFSECRLLDLVSSSVCSCWQQAQWRVSFAFPSVVMIGETSCEHGLLTQKCIYLPSWSHFRWGISALALIATLSQCLTIKAIQIGWQMRVCSVWYNQFYKLENEYRKNVFVKRIRK